MIVPVILCGGVGSRLWPLSRKTHPKQFLRVSGGHSLFQEAVLRAADTKYFASPLIICNEEYRFHVADHLDEIGVKNATIILEPMGKSTAPAIAVAAHVALSQNHHGPVLVLSSDHVISSSEKFLNTAKNASALARKNHLVTFGITPNRPATGFGYIKKGTKLGKGFNVAAFIEKPSLSKAKKLLKENHCVWNSGMFMFTPETYLAELEYFRPKIARWAQAAFERRTTDLGFIRLDRDAFRRCPEESIDYAVMEHTDKAAVVPLDAGWNDIGNWSSLWEVTKTNRYSNSAIGDVISQHTNGCYLRSENKLLVTLGIKDLIVVETRDATLVAAKGYAEKVKDIVKKLKRNKRQEYYNHRKEYRPWGWFESVDFAKNFQVKRLTIHPGASISLQKHSHRSEHWIIVKGGAHITRGSEELFLSEGESTFIPAGMKHRLENKGNTALEIVEVQTGNYLGEDDVVRFDDAYGRGKR